MNWDDPNLWRGWLCSVYHRIHPWLLVSRPSLRPTTMSWLVWSLAYNTWSMSTWQLEQGWQVTFIRLNQGQLINPTVSMLPSIAGFTAELLARADKILTSVRELWDRKSCSRDKQVPSRNRFHYLIRQKSIHLRRISNWTFTTWHPCIWMPCWVKQKLRIIPLMHLWVGLLLLLPMLQKLIDMERIFLMLFIGNSPRGRQSQTHNELGGEKRKGTNLLGVANGRSTSIRKEMGQELHGASSSHGWIIASQS